MKLSVPGMVQAVAQMLAVGVVARRGLAPAEAALTLEQVLPLDPRRRLCLVRCGERRLLLLTGGTQEIFCGWLPEPPADPPR